MINIILEAGINHFGKVSEAKKVIDYFIKSNFKELTFLISENEQNEFFKKKFKFSSLLPDRFYKSALEKVKKSKKKLGIGIYGPQGVLIAKKFNFDFYKLLSIGIKNKNVLNYLSKCNKKVLISTGGASVADISKALSSFKKKNKLTILHTPMVYDPSKLYLKKIKYLKKKFKTNVGYSNHHDCKDSILAVLSYNIDDLLIYIKPSRIRGRVYPDNKHALYIDELDDFLIRIYNVLKMHDLNLKPVVSDINNDKIKF